VVAQRTLCTQEPSLPLAPQERCFRKKFEVKMINAATTCPERSCTEELLTSSHVTVWWGLDANLSAVTQSFHAWRLSC